MRRLLVSLALLLLASTGVLLGQSLTEDGRPDYAAWDRDSDRATEVLDARLASNDALDVLRMQLSDWRALLLEAQSVNAEQIETLTDQIDALGPEPAEGASAEPEELATRRGLLQEQLSRANVPVRRAEEAFLEADGLIGQLDTLVRERQTERILKLGPSPLNPINWPLALSELGAVGANFAAEVSGNYASEVTRAALRNNLPVILVLFVLGIGLITRSGRWIDIALTRIRTRAGADQPRMRVGVFLLSLFALLAPVIGASLLIEAVDQSGMDGRLGQAFLSILSIVVLTVFSGRWLARQVFPPAYPPSPLFALDAAAMRRGRALVVWSAILLSIAFALGIFEEAGEISATTVAVLSFPIIALGAFVLFRIGRMLLAGTPMREEPQSEETPVYLVSTFVGRASALIALIGPVLAAIGYVEAGRMLLFSTLFSLALIGLVLVLQRVVRDLYAVFAGEERSKVALIPVILNFAIMLGALPFLALIWGARGADLWEAWTWISTGFQIGNSRISPTDFVTFALVFAIGYMLTRLIQGSLRTQVLPKTRLDTGGRNAVVSGTGYVGIFLSALIAITTAGIDLSSLAIVAGALSVGIGFGLQTIVSNFVSGIILLIERPISEGDWIEVSGTMGVVKDISVRATRIETFDRRDVIVPNADLISTAVVNWTKGNMTGRIIVPVGVAYGSDSKRVATLLQEIAEAHPSVILNPPPTVFFSGFGADSLDFEIRAILRDVSLSLGTQTEIRHEILRRFAKEGIEIPFAQRDLWLRNPETLHGPGPKGEPA